MKHFSKRIISVLISVLMVFSLFTVVSVTASATVDVMDGLKGYWTFDNDEVSTETTDVINKLKITNPEITDLAPDAKITGNDQINVVSDTAGRFSKDGHMLQMTNDKLYNDRMVIPDLFANSEAYSISMWINFSNIGDKQMNILQKSNADGFSADGSAGKALLFLKKDSNSNMQFCTFLGGTDVFLNNIKSVTPSQGDWHHIVLTSEEGADSVDRLYVDGEKVFEDTITGHSTENTYLFIGSPRENNARSFVGSMDEIRYYNKSISDDVVKRIYNLNIEKPVALENYNGAPSENTVSATKINDVDTLQANATTNSTNRGEDGADDGAAKFAFEGNESSSKRWIQSFNYGNTAYGSYAVASDTNPIWIQSGFGTGKDQAKVMGAIGYVAETNTGAQTIMSKYEVYASFVPSTKDTDFEDVKLTGTLVASGEFQNIRGLQMVYFDFPVKANYITLVAYGVHGSGSVAAGEINFYEYIGDTAVDIELKDAEGNVLATIPSEGSGTEHYITKDLVEVDAGAAQQAIVDADLSNEDFNDIKFDYTIAVTDNNYDATSKVVNVVSTPAKYTLTVNDGTESEPVILEYGKNFNYAAEGGEGVFQYWKDASENPVALGSVFNYKATQDYTITAVYGESEYSSYGAYIPAPIVSRKDKNWVVEIPVTLFNVDENVTDFGLVFANPTVYATDDALAAALESNSTSDLIKSSAVTTELTNKGRYLHRVTVNGAIPNSNVYAYIIVNGKAYLSNSQTISEHVAIM